MTKGKKTKAAPMLRTRAICMAGTLVPKVLAAVTSIVKHNRELKNSRTAWPLVLCTTTFARRGNILRYGPLAAGGSNLPTHRFYQFECQQLLNTRCSLNPCFLFRYFIAKQGRIRCFN